MSPEQFEEAKQEIVEELDEVEQTLAEALETLEALPLTIKRLREQGERPLLCLTETLDTWGRVYLYGTLPLGFLFEEY